MRSRDPKKISGLVMQSKLTPLLVDAKNEYVNKLADVLAPFVVCCFNGVFVHSRAAREGATIAFQRKLREIPSWNASTIRTQVAAVEQKYPFLEDLIAAAFVVYVRILSSVKVHAKEPNVNLQLPTTDVFVHRVFIESAREFFNDPRLIKADRATRMAVVRGAVETTVRELLPIRDILRAYVGDVVAGDVMNTRELDYEYVDSPYQAPQPPAQAPPDPPPAPVPPQFPQQFPQQAPQFPPQFPQQAPPQFPPPVPPPVPPQFPPQAPPPESVVPAPFPPAAALSPAGSPKFIRVPGAFVTPEESPGLFSDADDF